MVELLEPQNLIMVELLGPKFAKKAVLSKILSFHGGASNSTIFGKHVHLNENGPRIPKMG